MTKAEQTYTRVNELVDGGMQKAADFKLLAEEYGQPVDSVRGAYYGHKRVVETGGQPGTGRSTGRRTRKRETTTQDAIASAVATLEAAIDSIEVELEAARERAAEAQAEYEAMQAASTGRIEEIRAKIAVLDPEAADATADEAAPPTPAAKPSPSRKEVKGSSRPNEDWWQGTRG